MRTFEEVKTLIFKEGLRCKEIHQSKLLEPGITKEERNAREKWLDSIESVFENIDEAATIEIGYSTNKIIHAIKEQCQIDSNYYFSKFDDFCEFHIIGSIKSDDNRRCGLAKDECEILGITLSDLQILKGINPNTVGFGDNLREKVNLLMGTSIPMDAEFNKIKNECQINSEDNDKTLASKRVLLSEFQRDAGLLKSGHFGYNLLANDLMYQEAKEKISGRTL